MGAGQSPRRSERNPVGPPPVRRRPGRRRWPVAGRGRVRSRPPSPGRAEGRRSAVRLLRIRHAQAECRPKGPRPARDVALLGTGPDRAVAARTGRRRAMVRRKYVALRIIAQAEARPTYLGPNHRSRASDPTAARYILVSAEEPIATTRKWGR